MRILVVEDEKKVASFLKQGLEQSSYTVDVVHTGEDALDYALTNDYAAIVLDIMLPGRDGLSVVRELRSRKIGFPVQGENKPSPLSIAARGLKRIHDLSSATKAGSEICALLAATDRSRNLPSLDRSVSSRGIYQHADARIHRENARGSLEVGPAHRSTVE